MLIKGKINYKNGNKTNYAYDGEKFYTNPKEEIKVIDSKVDEKNSLLIGDWGEYFVWIDLDELSDNLEKIGANLTYQFEFTQDELKIGYDYLKNSYPVTFKYTDITVNDISDLMYIDICGNTLLQVVEMVEGYLEGYTGIYGNNTFFEILDYEYCYYIEKIFINYDDGVDFETALELLYQLKINGSDELDYIYFQESEKSIEEMIGYDLYNKFEKLGEQLNQTKNDLETLKEDTLEELQQKQQLTVRKQPASEKLNYLVN